MLNLSVNSLRAGYSVIQALESVSKEMPNPTNVEIRRVVQEVQIGLTLDTALENLLRRMSSPDLKLIVTAINIQREVGGNLAEILDTISHTIRERVRIKGEIRVLTSQQTVTGYLIGFLPFALAGFLYLDNRKYIMRFFDPDTRTCGIPMVVCGLLLIVSGFFIISKIVSIEV
jgi:tight adherence protein B